MPSHPHRQVMTASQVFHETFDSTPAWYQKENPASFFPPENIADLNMDRW